MSNRIPTKTVTCLFSGAILILVAWACGPSPSEQGEYEGQKAPVRQVDQAVTSPAKTEKPAEEGAPDPGATIDEQSANDGEARDFRVSNPSDYASVKPGNFFTTSMVEDLMPSDPQTDFTPGARVYAYAEVYAPRDETLKITWFDSKGQPVLPSAYLDVKTNMSAVGYRLFTYRSFRAAGQYSVVLYNSAGAEIVRESFSVK